MLESKWADASSDEEVVEKPLPQAKPRHRKEQRSKSSSKNGPPAISFAGGKLVIDSDEKSSSRRPKSPRKIILNRTSKAETGSESNKLHGKKGGNQNDVPSISFTGGKLVVEPKKPRKRSSSSKPKPNISFKGGKLVIQDVETDVEGMKSKPKPQAKSNEKKKDTMDLLKKKIEEQRQILEKTAHKKQQQQLLDEFLNADESFNWEDNSADVDEILEKLDTNLKIK